MLKMFVAVALGAASFIVQAGPPLICHPYDIGNAKSLPWVEAHDAMRFDGTDSRYDTKRLVQDTLRILDAGVPVLVRMETMRRAALYGANDHGSAASLLAALKERTATSSASALALFDYGYFAETLHQIEWKYKEDLSRGVDGYSYVQRALALQPDSAEMHFAAAIMSRQPARADYAEHLRKARSASSDALLAANIHSHLD